MAKKYIDAEDFIERFGDWYTEEGTEIGFIGPIKDLVEQMPAAVLPVPPDPHVAGVVIGVRRRPVQRQLPVSLRPLERILLRGRLRLRLGGRHLGRGGFGRGDTAGKRQQCRGKAQEQDAFHGDRPPCKRFVLRIW